MKTFIAWRGLRSLRSCWPSFRIRELAQIKIARRRADYRPECRFWRTAARTALKQAVEDHQRQGRRAWPEDRSFCRRRRFRSQRRACRSPTSFVGDGVKCVVGHFNSGVTIPASEVYARERHRWSITPSARRPKRSPIALLWNVFRACGRDDQQSEVAGKYLAAPTFKGKKVAIRSRQDDLRAGPR